MAEMLPATPGDAGEAPDSATRAPSPQRQMTLDARSLVYTPETARTSGGLVDPLVLASVTLAQDPLDIFFH
jgi:hypothetical protein